MTKEEYNDIPVVYCKHCMSLKIRVLDDNIDYCDNCGSTDVDSVDIDTWEKMYEKRFGRPFIEKVKI